MKTKSTTSAPLTIDDINILLNRYAMDCFEHERLTAELDQELTDVRKTYAPNLDPLSARILETHNTIKAWAEANRAQLFPAKKKSLKLLHAIIGFNIGQPTLALLRGFKWEDVLENLKGKFTRNKPEVDKKALLAKRNLWPTEEYAALGLRVAQSESFYIKPVATQTDTVDQTEPRASASGPSQKAA